VNAGAPSGRRSTVRRALTGGAIVLGAAAAGFLLHHLSGPVRTALLPPPAETAGSAASSPGHEDRTIHENRRRIPDDVPPISLPGLDGKVHKLTDYRGKLLLINFWATWCEPCRREIPLLMSLRTENAKDGLEIVGIAIDSRDPVAKYVQDHLMRYPVLIGDHAGFETAQAFGMETVLPFSVFADRAGHVVALKVGELQAEEARLILAVLKDLDHGRLTLPAAQTRIAEGLAALNAARRGAPASDPE
jgi:thiol-disulfide isomerase/thioredoxin